RNPNASGNPYLPFDPTGALFAPLGLLGLIYGRKKRKNKFDYFVIVIFLTLGVGLGLTACGDPPAGNFTATGTAIQVPGGIVATGTVTYSNATTDTGAVFIPSSTPTNTPTVTPCATPTSTPTPSNTPSPTPTPNS